MKVEDFEKFEHMLRLNSSEIKVTCSKVVRTCPSSSSFEMPVRMNFFQKVPPDFSLAEAPFLKRNSKVIFFFTFACSDLLEK